MLAVEDGVFILARRIDNLGREVGVLVSDHFTKGVLDGRVVGVYEVAVDILDGQGALAWVGLADSAVHLSFRATLTDRSAADNSHLSLLLLGCHCVQAVSASLLDGPRQCNAIQ